jgi:hypothetical protein
VAVIWSCFLIKLLILKACLYDSNSEECFAVPMRLLLTIEQMVLRPFREHFPDGAVSSTQAVCSLWRCRPIQVQSHFEPDLELYLFLPAQLKVM